MITPLSPLPFSSSSAVWGPSVWGSVAHHFLLLSFIMLFVQSSAWCKLSRTGGSRPGVLISLSPHLLLLFTYQLSYFLYLFIPALLDAPYSHPSVSCCLSSEALGLGFAAQANCEDDSPLYLHLSFPKWSTEEFSVSLLTPQCLGFQSQPSIYLNFPISQSLWYPKDPFKNWQFSTFSIFGYSYVEAATFPSQTRL